MGAWFCFKLFSVFFKLWPSCSCWLLQVNTLLFIIDWYLEDSVSQIKTGCFSFIKSLEIDNTFMVLAEQLEENLKTLDGLRAINIFYLLLGRTSEKILRCAVLFSLKVHWFACMELVSTVKLMTLVLSSLHLHSWWEVHTIEKKISKGSFCLLEKYWIVKGDLRSLKHYEFSVYVLHVYKQLVH